MVAIESKEAAYAYDIQSLVKAFYPGEDIAVVENLEEAKELAEDKVIKVNLFEDSVGISFYKNGIPILEKAHSKIFEKITETLEAEVLKEAKRKLYKNELKIVLYEVLSKVTGRELSWGTLTGVRPTKIPMAHLMEGQEEENIKKSMKEQYLCQDNKIDMSIEIAKKEVSILEEIDYMNGYSVYIGIPFCPTTCSYCSFTSFPFEKNKQHAENYLKALFKEIEYGATCIKNKKLTTIYIGGGTPTALNEQMLKALIAKVKECFDFTYVREFTVEAGRPDSITREKLEIMKEMGVTRISINPQTMKEKTLELIGRKHSAGQVKDAFLLARETGHDNINMDLIVGLPEETLEDVKTTLEEIKVLNPDSITIHSLVTKRAARMNIQKEEDATEDVDAMSDYGYEFCISNGYAPYYMYRQKNAAGSVRSCNQENIGYAREGKEGIYNILIMEEVQTILALGAGASSKFVFPETGAVERVENVKSLIDYITRIDEMIERKKVFLAKHNI